MFKNMKIAKKLIVAFIAVVLISSIAGVVGLLLMNTLDVNYSKALVANGFVLGDIGDYNTYLNKGGAVVRDIITMTDTSEIEAAQKELEVIKQQTQAALDAAKVNCKTPAELEIVARIEEAAPKYKAARDKAIELGLQNRSAEAMRMFHDEARQYLNECMTGGQELMDLNRKLGNQVSADMTNQARVGMIIMAAVMLIGIAIAVVIATIVARSISRPVRMCAERLGLLAEGDLHSEVPAATSNDEVGVMLDSLKVTTDFLDSVIGDIGRGLGEMAAGNLKVSSVLDYKGDFNALKLSIRGIIESFNSTLGQINQASDQVASGSDQVSSGAQALSQGATEQASAVEELAATIAEISAQIKHNAENAKAANGVSDESSEGVADSNNKMSRMIDAMNEITNTSNEIGKIIKTIDDIAFQTNILALNAAVEAARAGAAGKGFAVVADEVRNLAGKSAAAAKNTTALIESAITAISSGTQIAGETAKSLEMVVEKSSIVSAKISEIAKASDEQATAILQVTTGVDQISSVVQTNSATAEESAAASEELSGQAQMLKTLVGRFKLKDDNSYGMSDAAAAVEEITTRHSHTAPQSMGAKY